MLYIVAHVDRARPVRALGQRRVGVLAVADGDHAPELPVSQQVDGDVGERDRHHLVERVGVARAQVIGEVAVHGLDAGRRFSSSASASPTSALWRWPYASASPTSPSSPPVHMAPSLAMTNA